MNKRQKEARQQLEAANFTLGALLGLRISKKLGQELYDVYVHEDNRQIISNYPASSLGYWLTGYAKGQEEQLRICKANKHEHP